MAGIGFELKKLFDKKGLTATVRAYGYAGVVCAGPMLLGVALLLSLRLIAIGAGATAAEQDALVTMISYTLIASLFSTAAAGMVATRFTADMLYLNEPERVLPAFYGSTSLLLAFGGAAFGAFLLFSGVAVTYRLLCFLLFCELTIVWMEIVFITAVKNYRAIIAIFFLGVLCALLAALALVFAGAELISALLTAVCVGYGMMMTGYFAVLHRYFPKGKGSVFSFLAWFERCPALAPTGIFLTAGLFAHLIITWFGPMGARVSGLFYASAQYDICALIAFLSTLPTIVNFVTATEVNFYPKYRRYFSLLNGKGSVKELELAEWEMLSVLKRELTYLAQKQIIVTMLFLVVGRPALVAMGLGFSETMFGMLRVLLIGYGLYAVANSILLTLLYFADDRGALLVAFVFLFSSIAGTLFLLNGSPNYYGFGFLFGAASMYATAYARLLLYTGKLSYRVLRAQRRAILRRTGPLTALSRWAQARKEAEKTPQMPQKERTV